jgi:hypothetical protein
MLNSFWFKFILYVVGVIIMITLVGIGLNSCDIQPITAKITITVKGDSIIKVSYANYEEDIDVNGFLLKSFNVPVGESFTIKWSSKTDKEIVVSLKHSLTERYGDGKSGIIVYDMEDSDCFINSLGGNKNEV